MQSIGFIATPNGINLTLTTLQCGVQWSLINWPQRTSLYVIIGPHTMQVCNSSNIFVHPIIIKLINIHWVHIMIILTNVIKIYSKLPIPVKGQSSLKSQTQLLSTVKIVFTKKYNERMQLSLTSRKKKNFQKHF